MYRREGGGWGIVESQIHLGLEVSINVKDMRPWTAASLPTCAHKLLVQRLKFADPALCRVGEQDLAACRGVHALVAIHGRLRHVKSCVWDRAGMGGWRW